MRTICNGTPPHVLGNPSDGNGMTTGMAERPTTREQLLHMLYEAAELEHTLMCTYLYAAFSLKDGDDGLRPEEAAAVARWRSTLLHVSVEEMGHLTAVWNITAALGGQPRFGRANFPLDPGHLPASVVVKLAPFGEAVIQHFVFLERPAGSVEHDGEGFASPLQFARGSTGTSLVPMALDYETVGTFYERLGTMLAELVARVGEENAFCGDPALQLSPSEITILGARPVICTKTALGAFHAIVEQGEGAPEDSTGSHFQKFVGIREELRALRAANPDFEPAHPAAHNPVLRRPPRPEGRVWLEDPEAVRTVDLANAGYGLMLRLLAYSYSVPRPDPAKALAVDLSLTLMRAVTHLAEHAARLPAGPSNPHCTAGMSFTALRDAAPLPHRASSWRFFAERFRELADATRDFGSAAPRIEKATRILVDLARRAERELAGVVGEPTASAAPPAPPATPGAPPVPVVVEGVEHIEGRSLTLLYETRRCIHARFCVTGAPKVFLANVKGPWIDPDGLETSGLVEIAHACPSGAIRYQRKDGGHDERPPPVNLLTIREGGPYAVRGDLRIDGSSGAYRATLCRCGASRNKPYCDGSHNDAGFAASGEPPSNQASLTGPVSTDMLAVRDGALTIDPQVDGPLQVRGNLEITSGTGRVVGRTVQARLCRCGGSRTKPFCDNTHLANGFRSD